MSVMAIRVENKTYEEICTRVPIANIFHTRQRGRRAAVVLTEQQSPSDLPPSDLPPSDLPPSDLPPSDLPPSLYEDGQQTSDESVSFSSHKTSSDKEAVVAVVVNATATQPGGDLYDTLWADYDYNYDIKVATAAAAAKVRIDFDKFGARRRGEDAATKDGKDGKDVKDGKDGTDLPRDIYCDLVESLEDLCLQTNLLEIWRYDKARGKWITSGGIQRIELYSTVLWGGGGGREGRGHEMGGTGEV